MNNNDFIKLMVLAYENPARFVQQNGAQQYMDNSQTLSAMDPAQLALTLV